MKSLKLSQLKQKLADFELSTVVCWILFASGIEIGPSGRCSRVRLTAVRLFRALTVAFWAVLSVDTALLASHEAPGFDKEGFKLMATVLFLRYSVLLVWVMLLKEQKSLASLLEFVRRFRGRHQLKAKRSLTKACIALVLLLDAGMLGSKIFYFDRGAEKMKLFQSVESYVLGFQDDALYKSFRALFLFYVYFVPATFTALYCSLCDDLSQFLVRQSQCNASVTLRVCPGEDPDLERSLARYKDVLEFHSRFEATLSLPVFLVFGLKCAGILLNFLKILGGTGVPVHNATFFVHCFTAVSVIVLVAARVEECDRAAKRSNMQVFELSLPGAGTGGGRVVKLAEFCRLSSERPIAMTGWDFFRFSKNFYLNVLGCIVTYLLLILSL